jgi:two-component system cell cycle sensor histidine kinase/response regulator CckA
MKLEYQFERLQLLYELSQAVNRADEPGEVYRAAVEGLVRVVAADRASVMIFDADGVMRYKAWKGISDRHRAAMERPISINWRRGARNVQAVTVADVTKDPSLSPLLPAFASEGIRALARIPLLGNGGLIGKFVLYYNAPHEFLTEEIQLAQTIATHVAFAAERHLAEAALRESEERFRRVFEEGPLGLALVGKDYRFLKVNGALCQMVGYSEAELLQMSFPDITHPDDLGANVELAEKVFKHEIPFYQLQKRYVRKNGEIIWIKLTASVLHDQRDEALYGLGMIEDVTELKRTQEEALARQKLESLGVLAGGIAHDFNNLLGGILAQAELLEADLPPYLPPVEEIHRIKQSALRGSEIVRELMFYAGQNQTDLVEAVDVSCLAEEMLELLNVSISKHAVLKTDFGDNLPTVRGNAAQLRQVVMNLVINASEAIGEKQGVISVATAQVSGSENLAFNGATTLPHGDYVRLQVSDTGCGMTEAVKAKIFDPFFSTKFAGRGLGLAVVQGIVLAHDGDINLSSMPGEGTIFQVFLPCTHQSVAKVHRAISSSGVGQSKARTGTILVVEDEETLRLAVSKALRRKGFSVMEATDGSGAMDLLRAHKDEIDVVLLDVTLPGIASREVFEETQRMRPELKVIVTSAYSKETVDASFAGLAVENFIRKPFQLDDIALRLGQVMSGDARPGRTT